MKKRFYFLMLLLLLVAACSGNTNNTTNAVPRSSIDSQTKAEIEKAVREFWAKQRKKDTATGFSYHKFSDTLYVVGTTFSDYEGGAGNTVVRKFESNNQPFWKVERFDD